MTKIPSTLPSTPTRPSQKTSVESRALRDAVIKQAFEDEAKLPALLSHQEHVERVTQH
ncbi:hypothetical protein BT96DRAFT_1000777 [Gymnopus androsaceus JB14]|uniref:Uncharacterized protein n=1 Tax=Gymnopus androsaceus JB14 TaxID=1447944 RepID=A0A6A4H4F3_9AGAR|nr:hypothetical protein BT96DRAFT_1000777 [Gymnopus androsaceus JB14]